MASSFGARALAAAGLCMLRVSGAAAACATNNVNSPATGGFKSMVCPADTSVPHTPKCLLVLPGKGNNHDGFTLFQETAARMGYSAFSIQYQASPDTFSQCHVDYNDHDCSLKVRTAKQEGGTHGTKGSQKVDVKISVDTRTLYMLKYLAGLEDTKPPESAGGTEQWLNCLQLTGGEYEVNWSKIAAMGGSEGSGQAAFVGYAHKIDRVMMFSGIVDAIEYDLKAGNYTATPWLVDGKGKTPHMKYWGFGEIYGGACRAWSVNFNAMKIPATWTNVNLVNPTYGYGNAHKMCSDRTKSAAGHLTTVWDKNTPKDSKGQPIYRPVWEHMLGSTETDYSSVANATARKDPNPVPAGTPVALMDCDGYKSVLQRWALDTTTQHIKLIDSLDKPEGQPLVLTCQSSSCNVGQRMEVKAVVEGDVAQQWQFEGNHFVSSVSKQCIGTDPSPEPEAGLLVLQDCASPTVAKWTYDKSTAHYTTEGVCLGTKYSNATKCQCVF